MSEVKAKKKISIVLIVAVAVLLLVIAIVSVLMISGSDKNKLSKSMKLANAYLAELNYEGAIKAFETVLEIDPENVEAYYGIISAYVGIGDEDMAYAYAQILADKDANVSLEEILNRFGLTKAEEASGEEDNSVEEDVVVEEETPNLLEGIDYEEFYARLFHDYWLYTAGLSKFISISSFKEQLDSYNALEIAEFFCATGKEIGYLLNLVYLSLNDLEKAKEYARYVVEKNPNNDTVYDDYGRILKAENSVCTYYEGTGLLQTWWTEGDYYELEYDENGRTTMERVTYADGYISEWRNEFVDEHTVKRTNIYNGNPSALYYIRKYDIDFELYDEYSYQIINGESVLLEEKLRVKSY